VTITVRTGERMPDTYEDIYRELVEHPVPREGLVLPNDVWRRHVRVEDVAETQHDKLVRALYEAIITAWAETEKDVAPALRFSRPKE